MRISGLFSRLKNWTTQVWPGIDSAKKWIEVVQAVVTICGIAVGAVWTYRLFVEQREGFAHANFEETISSVALTDQVRLVQVVLRLENTGHSLIKVTNATVRIQQVLPILGCDATESCAARELNAALDSAKRVGSRFAWPLVAARDESTLEPIEPGEKALLDFEFAVPSSVEMARVYGFIQNDELTEKRRTPVGWNDAQIYDLRSTKEVTKDANKKSTRAAGRSNGGNSRHSPTG